MKYSKEFKQQAIKLSDEIGVRNAYAQLGIVYGTLSDWRKTYKLRPFVNTKKIAV